MFPVLPFGEGEGEFWLSLSDFCRFKLATTALDISELFLLFDFDEGEALPGLDDIMMTPSTYQAHKM